MSKDYADIATQYAHRCGRRPRARLQVGAPGLPSGTWIRPGCARSGTDWPYVFNPELVDTQDRQGLPPGAARVQALPSSCRTSRATGPARGERIRLRAVAGVHPGQHLRLGHCRNSGKRRFRKADRLRAAQECQKSRDGRGDRQLYMLALDDEFGAEVYSGANLAATRRMEVFKPAKLYMAHRLSTEYRAAVRRGAQVPATWRCIEPPTASSSRSSASRATVHRPAAPSLTSITSTRRPTCTTPWPPAWARGHSRCMLVITTCRRQHRRPLLHASGGAAEASSRAWAASAEHEQPASASSTPPTKKTTGPRSAALIKANPNFGVIDQRRVSCRPSLAGGDRRRPAQAKRLPKTKHLNLWVGAASPWVNLEPTCSAAGDSTDLQH